MAWKKFNIITFSMLLCIILLVPVVNFVVDPYDVFKSDMFKNQYQVNARVSKINFLENNHSNYNSYLFGSSRIGTTDPSVIDKYLPESRFYNITLTGANMYDHLVILKYFLKQGFEVKNIYLQFDVMESLIAYGRPDDNYLTRHHPHVTNSSTLKFYWTYLTIFPKDNILGKLEANFGEGYSITHNQNKGTWYAKEYENQIKKDHEEYIKNQSTFNQAVKRTIKNEKVEQNIRALKDIKSLADLNNINLVVFVTPHHHKMMDSFVVEDYLNLLKEISNVTEFWNFSGYNTITLNDENYYEHSHYRPFIGKLIAAKIFNDETVKIPPDFGVYITKNNISSYLKELEKQIKDYDIKKRIEIIKM